MKIYKNIIFILLFLVAGCSSYHSTSTLHDVYWPADGPVVPNIDGINAPLTQANNSASKIQNIVNSAAPINKVKINSDIDSLKSNINDAKNKVLIASVKATTVLNEYHTNLQNSIDNTNKLKSEVSSDKSMILNLENQNNTVQKAWTNKFLVLGGLSFILVVIAIAVGIIFKQYVLGFGLAIAGIAGIGLAIFLTVLLQYLIYIMVGVFVLILIIILILWIERGKLSNVFFFPKTA